MKKTFSLKSIAKYLSKRFKWVSNDSPKFIKCSTEFSDNKTSFSMVTNILQMNKNLDKISQLKKDF